MYFCLGIKKPAKVFGLFFGFLLISYLLVFLIKTSTIHAEKKEISMPIIMYHSILKDPSAQGKWVLSPAMLESDLGYLKDNGYTTVTVKDLLNYIYYDKMIPEKPVMITFDDGHYNNLVYALPLLEKYNMKAVVSIVGEYSEQFSISNDKNAAYSYLTWEDIKLLSDSGRFEIANHSYYMHNNSSRNGAMKLNYESDEEYRQALTDDLSKLQKTLINECGVMPLTFTYPFGAISDESLPILKDLGFHASFTCYEKPNYISKDPDSLFGLNRYNRPAGISSEEFMKKALQD